ncbi:hypothetical protein [Paraburkholderia sp. Ac-20340]|uniref:hypothetical protein n=1 Tax=Paraburkholderia sp. Ac-20340 TaxID=2703888 RepID=UPI001F121A8D|nr:hypothetical protein [Paraburkholderia sp. Ac-20340]
MQTICRNSLIAVLLCWFCASCVSAMSQGSIDLDIRQVDGKPAFCLPASDDTGSNPIQIRRVGVSRSTGVTTPAVTYWNATLPDSAPPVYLKRGECLVYGQTVSGAIVDTPAKPLNANNYYDVTIMHAGETGAVYSSIFCVLRQADGSIRIAVPGKQHNPCASLGD